MFAGAAVAAHGAGRDGDAVDRLARRVGVPSGDEGLIVEEHDDSRDTLVEGRDR